MTAMSEHPTRQGSGSAGLRVFVLALFTAVTAIVAVSFAADHLRNGFEREYKDQMNHSLLNLASSTALLIDGDDMTDLARTQAKYSAVLPAVIVDSGAEDQVKKAYALYSYSNGSLSMILQSSDTGLRAMEVPVSEWLTTQADPYYIYDRDRSTILTPIKDSQGKVTGLYEITASYSFLDTFGTKIEKNILLVVLVAVLAGMFLFSLQYIVPVIVNLIRKKGGRSV